MTLDVAEVRSILGPDFDHVDDKRIMEIVSMLETTSLILIETKLLENKEALNRTISQ